MDISFELYKVFYYVASTLSFSEASRRLYLSQSAVSQSIKSLEQKLGQSLFFRSTKQVRLTPEGEILLQHVEPAVTLLLQGEQKLTNPDSSRLPLRIGASDTICRYFLVPYLKRFHEEYPNIPIKVMNATSVGCVDLLENHQVDLIISNSPNTKLKSDLVLKKLCDFQDVFIANNQFFPLEDTVLSLEELLNYPILMLDKISTTSEFLHTIFREKGLELSPEAELSSNDLLIDLANIGLGIAFVPDYALNHRKENLIQLKIKEALPKRHLVLACKEHAIASGFAEKFLSFFNTH